MEYETIVIGAGPAGYVCAIRLAQLGKKVLVIEQEDLGGVCLNRGCIPSKALIYAGGIFQKIQEAGEMGITVSSPKVDIEKLIAWKDGIVQKLTGGVSTLLKANSCSVIKGSAKFLSPNSVEVTATVGPTLSVVKFQTCVIATGSRPSGLPGFEVDNRQIFDSTGALAIKKIPKDLLCVGGGYIGLELGTFYSKIGTEVTVVEALPNLLSGVDPDLTKVVQKKLEKKGVKILLGTRAKFVGKTSKGVQVQLGEMPTKAFEAVLVTVGRRPNSDFLDLEKAGLRTDEKGFLVVDEKRRTMISHIFAIGDIAGQPLLAHKGSKEGIVAAEAIAGLNVAYDVAAMPAVIFTDPEIATVGMTEAQAKENRKTVDIGIFPFAANGRALSVNEPDGFVKMIAEPKGGRLLGVHIVGAEASNLISEAALAIEMGASVEDIALTVHPHPTLPEALMEAAEATLGHAIHLFQKKATAPAKLNPVVPPQNFN